MIAHIVAGGGLYGLERVLVNLLPALRRRGAAVGLICLAPRGAAAAEVGEVLEAEGVPTAFVGGFWYGAPARAVLHAWRPAALHAHGYKATIAGGTLALLTRRPLLATYHGEAGAAIRHAAGAARARLRAYLTMESAVLRRARAIAAVSAPICEELLRRGIPPERVVVLANGIRPGVAPRPTGPRYFSPQLVVAGRLVEGKNVHTAIAALATVRHSHASAGLLVAGTGPLESHLMATAAQLGMAEAVRFAGFVPNIAEVLAHSDCLVMPSSSEGLPLTVLEAMAARLPIVAAGIGAIPEVVRDEKEALLVPPRDAVALADRVLRLLADRALRERLAAAAHERFLDEYTDDAMAARYEAFYARFLATAWRTA